MRRCSWLVLIAAGAVVSSLAWAKDHLYTDATTARIGPKALASLHNLRGAGVVEILVPTWLPADLQNLRVKKADSTASRFGPELDMEWPSDNPHHSLRAHGSSGGFGGPGPDSTVKVSNPTLGDVDLWICDKAEFSARYCTDWVPVPGSMPTLPNDRRFYLLFDSVDKHADSLSVDEMKRILASLRYFRIP